MPTRAAPNDPSRAAVYAGVTAAILALALLFWFAFSYVLLLFLGVLLAILLRAPTDWLARRTGMRDGFALALVCLLLAALLGAVGYFFGTTIAAQTAELSSRLPGSSSRCSIGCAPRRGASACSRSPPAASRSTRRRWPARR
jgi:predicted PurR-regulated permease PerM